MSPVQFHDHTRASVYIYMSCASCGSDLLPSKPLFGLSLFRVAPCLPAAMGAPSCPPCPRPHLPGAGGSRPGPLVRRRRFAVAQWHEAAVALQRPLRRVFPWQPEAGACVCSPRHCSQTLHVRPQAGTGPSCAPTNQGARRRKARPSPRHGSQ